MDCELRFGHHRIQAESSDCEVLARLREDFKHCGSMQSAPGKSHQLIIYDSPPSSGVRLWPIFRGQQAKCRGWGRRRRVNYNDGSVVYSDHVKNRTEIWAPTLDRRHELAYLFILSRVGEWFDQESRHRAHGLGLVYRKRAALLLMDSGVGKSTMALSLANAPAELSIASDEIPLVSGQTLFGFPLRAAVSRATAQRLGQDPTHWPRWRRLAYPEKVLVDLATLAPLASSAALSRVVVCRRESDLQMPVLNPISRVRGFQALMRSMGVGIGVPQMAEHFLRFDPGHFLTLSKIAKSRTLTALRVSRRIPFYELRLSTDHAQNLKVIQDLLDD